MGVLRSSLLSLVLVGCGGGGGQEAVLDAAPLDTVDAAVDAGEWIPPELPLPVEAPALPALLPCPTGWREVPDPEVAGVATCDPWPESGRATCADDEAHFPGGPGCERIGSACPEGLWADDLPPHDGAVVHVDPGAPAQGSDGSEEHPYPSIDTALRRSSPGDLVLLARGTYAEPVVLTKAVTLWGACVRDTVLAPSSGTAIEATDAGGAVVGNLTIAGGGAGIAVFGNAAPIVLDAVVLRDVSGAALGVVDASLEVRDSAVRDVLDDGGLADGADVIAGSRLELARVVFERAGSQGIYASGGSSLVARDVAILDGRPDPGGDLGIGLNLFAGTQVELERVVVERALTHGISVSGDDSELVATDLRVTGTEPRAQDGERGEGIRVGPGAHAAVARSSLAANRSSGLRIEDGGDAVLTDLVVTETRANDADETHGDGLAVSGAVTATRSALLRNTGAGLSVDGAATVSDLLVHGTTGPTGFEGDGVLVLGEGALELSRGSLEANGGRGLSVQGPRAEVTAFDLAVLDSGPVPSPGAHVGMAVCLRDGARATIERASLVGNRAGIGAGGDYTVLVGRDVAIEDTDPDATGFGLGLVAGGRGTEVTLDRSLLARNVSFAIGATEHARVVLRDVTVRETAERRDCPSDICVGIGISSIDDARVEATHFVLSDHARAAVQVAGGDVRLHDGVISGNPIGANVQDEGFVVERLRDHVVFVDNELDLDARALPVPDVGFLP